MKKIPFILFSLILGAVILAGCGEWLAKRKAERDDAKKQAEAAKQAETARDSTSTSAKTNICNDTLELADIMLIEPNIPLNPNAIGGSWIYRFDTTKSQLMFNLNQETIFTCYQYLFKWQEINIADSFVLIPQRTIIDLKHDVLGYSFLQYNNGIPVDEVTSCGFGMVHGKPQSMYAHIKKIKESHIPTISLREATLAMMKATYPTYYTGEADEWRRKYYVVHKHFPSDSLNPYRVPKQDPLAKFDWQIGKGDSLYMPEREIGTLVWHDGYAKPLNDTYLTYKFYVTLLTDFGFNTFIVWVSAHTGAVLEQYAVVEHG
jgi:hypothetical protein